MDDEANVSQDATIWETGRFQKPLTPEQYEQGRAMLNRLPPGIYIKCSKCAKFQHAGTISITTQGVFCERCSR